MVLCCKNSPDKTWYFGKKWRPDLDSAQKTILKMTYLIPWAHKSLLLTSVIGVDNSACISKNRVHHFSGRFCRLGLLWSRFSPFSSLFWLFLCLWGVLVYPCRPHDWVYFPLRANTAPISPRFFSHPIFRAKLKTLYFAICLWPQLFCTLLFVDHSKSYREFCQWFRG